jgi:putative Mg2+ transporter-C (MgtC) family protein
MDKIVNLISRMQQIECLVILFKLVLVVLLAGIIGWEREAWNKPAGLRTHILLGVSAVLISCIGIKVSETTNADISRLPAQLLSGIGFLGAGTILRDGHDIKGLTTATTLLTVTAIGLCIGMGCYILGILGTAVIYIVLSYSHILSDRLEKFPFIKLIVTCGSPKETIDEVKEILESDKMDISKIDIQNNGKKSYIEVEGKTEANIDKNKILSSLLKIEDVNGVDFIK